jgi:type I restriction enzyme R subunit
VVLLGDLRQLLVEEALRLREVRPVAGRLEDEPVDRTLTGYEGLMAAQECLPNNDVRDSFASEFRVPTQMWEALSPDPFLTACKDDYRWLAQVYASVQPTSGTGKLLWRALGAKTIDLIHENIHVESVRDDLETLVMDADLIDEVMGDPRKKAGESQMKIITRHRKHMGDPRYRALSERLESLRERHEKGLIASVEFLKQLLDLARDLIALEKETPVDADEDRRKAALTELFEQARNDVTAEDLAIIFDRQEEAAMPQP